jgi:hypothetical protein
VQAAPAPVPQIKFGTDISVCSGSGGNIANGAPQSFVVGQQVALVGCAPTNLTVSNQSWTSPSGTAIGGYNASASSGTITQFQQSSNPATTLFYWLDPGNSRTLTYTYWLKNGDSNSATVTFNVAAAPTVNVNIPTTSITISTVQDCNANALQILIFATNVNGTYPAPGQTCLSNLSGTPGITFTGSVANPSPSGLAGTFLWVQLLPSITSTQNDNINILGTSPASTGRIVTTAGLDKQYPASAGLSSQDSPAGPISNDQELNRIFTATMYLLWDPTLSAAGQSTCRAAAPPNSASTCASIPVPIGYVSWGFAADVIQTLKNQVSTGTTWIFNCSSISPPSPSFHSITNVSQENGYGYPTWTATAVNQVQ